MRLTNWYHWERGASATGLWISGSILVSSQAEDRKCPCWGCYGRPFLSLFFFLLEVHHDKVLMHASRILGLEWEDSGYMYFPGFTALQVLVLPWR